MKAPANSLPATKKSKFSMPHGYVVLFLVIVFCMILTWVVPAGQFERALDEATGRTLVVPGTYANIDQSPVNPISMLTCIFKGFEAAGSTVFFTFFAFVYINFIFKSGAMAGAVKALVKLTHGHNQFIIPVFMVFFAILGTTSGTVEATYGMIPVFIGIAIALGYDAMVGLCMIELGVFTGFYCSTLNPFTIGLAQQIAGLPMFSGIGFRLLILCSILPLVIWYTMRYAKKVKANPELSVVKDLDFGDMSLGEGAIENAQWTLREQLIVGSFGITVLIMVYGAIFKGWGTYQYATLFLFMMIATGVVAGWNANQIAENFVSAAMTGLFGCFIIGLSRGVLVVLESGQIIDTIIYVLSLPLSKMPSWLGAQGMMLVQQCINFLIPSGSGQAATTMPIMAPLADLVGINRQIAVLAFQFGDGFSNLLWPTCPVMIFTGIAKIPLSRWYKFFLPLAGVLFIILMGWMGIASAINFGPF